MEEKKRLHLGAIFSNFDDTCQYDVWTGIVNFACENDIQLTAYIGMYQTTDYDIASHYETCFELIKNTAYLDGVIIFSGSIASTIGFEEFERYVAKIAGIIPVISVSYILQDITSVLVDNKAGIYDAVEHLIHTHGKKHIAFVKGPEGHIEAEERFEGYKKALEDNGIAFDKRYVFPGSFTHEGGHLAVQKLYDMTEITADAIVSCDDTSAVGVLNELKKRNVLVPADIVVAGFDDDRDSATFIPSISTVRQDFCKLGSISAELLLKKISGKPVEAVTYMSPVFIARQSCGCLEVEFSDIETGSRDNLDDRNSFSAYVTQGFIYFFKQNVPELQIKEWASSLIDAIMDKPFSKDVFLRLLNEQLISYSQYSKDVLIWNDALNILTKGIELYNDAVDCTQTVMSAFIHATALIQEIRFKEVRIADIVASDKRMMLRRVAANIVSIFDTDTLITELQKSLPEFSLSAAIIGLYASHIKSNNPDADRTIKLVIGFDGEKRLNPNKKRNNFSEFPALSDIEGFDSKTKRNFILFPLFFMDEEYGVLLLPFNPDISVDIYETLRVNISTAIKGASLMEEVGNQNNLLQYALEKATEASKAKSAFLSAMSHEMRTPMNAIIGMTAIGKKAIEVEEKNYTLSRIEDASSHLLGVINDVLDMAKIEANKLDLSPVEFNFDRMLQKVLAIIKYRSDEREQTLSVSVDSKIPRFIVCDDIRLMQVITNLLSNAIKFTPVGGDVRLEISFLNERDGYCELCISVIDNGIGISHEHQENLFNAFEQVESGTSRNYGGTGLGLVISKRIIELMGGRIWVESELGKGAKFSFIINVLCSEDDSRLPIACDLSSGRNKNIVEHGAFAGKRVLLVEDIDINREIFIALLEELGPTIEIAKNGKEAVDMVETDSEGFDIIFMDIQMPVMNGYEATRYIRSLPALQNIRVPIIAMTANVFKSDIEECIAAGMDAHIGKPLDMDKLHQVLTKYLND